jgi:putative hydrolase of HD superfamily
MAAGRHDPAPAMSQQTKMFDLLALAERLRTGLRQSWLASGRQESVAEHCFQMALMALMVHPHLALPVDPGKDRS